ncbi:hypothetical protein SPWS13_2614 [Shewanella putrefaciens]|nr:hypothetical protein SPWS13_2614 [Shewanella putrefaciens]
MLLRQPLMLYRIISQRIAPRITPAIAAPASGEFISNKL